MYFCRSQDKHVAVSDTGEGMSNTDASCSQVTTFLVNYRVALLLRNGQPPQDHHRALGIRLLQGHGGGLYLVSEVHLYHVLVYSMFLFTQCIRS